MLFDLVTFFDNLYDIDEIASWHPYKLDYMIAAKSKHNEKKWVQAKKEEELMNKMR